VKRAQRFLGWADDVAVEPAIHRLDGFDAGHGPRAGVSEEDVVLLPVVRGTQPIACLLVVPSGEPDEQRLRLLYSATNQLSLHFERLRRAHEAEADRFRAIVEAMPQGVLLVDRNLQIVQLNRAAERMLATCGADGTGGIEAAFERMGLASLMESVCDGTRAVAEGEAQVEGGRIWSVSISRVPGASPAGDGLVFVLSDRTESRRMQQQLAQAETLSSLGQMISGVAHELNNPLASIIWYAQLIRGTASGDEKLVRRLEVLGREADRCRKIVENLLSFVRRREPERTVLSLNLVVERVVALLAYQLRVDGVRIELELSQELPPVEGDAHQLEQMLVNLLTNAAHAIRESCESGSVTLSTRVEERDSVVLEIRDTGPGVPQELRAKIFDPFFTTKGPGQGTGLGLSLVHGIVTDHGGTVEALPAEDGGTTFRIRLPAHNGQHVPEAAPSKSVRQPRAQAGRVLVVDDDDAVARMICEALAGAGLIARRARDGADALERLGMEEFDLILCDVKMPDMNGERLFDELQVRSPALVRRLLWTTGDTLGSLPERLAERTGCEVLTKPFDLDVLCDRVREQLAK
jgi:two-component system NtrC family sensor kinase